MRLWSLHPKHLDAKGLVALWREGLLARAVLSGKTKGYRNHPQLERFRRLKDPVAALDAYLTQVVLEAEARGYKFDRRKIRRRRARTLPVSEGQLAYEWQHLLAKLRLRDRARWRRAKADAPTTHPSFHVVTGDVESWERPTSSRARTRAGAASPRRRSTARTAV